MERTFWDMAEPSEWEIDGRTVRMLFTMRAAARLEKLLGCSYEAIVFEMLQTDANGRADLPPMAMERQAQVVMVVMQEAGEQVTMEQLLGLHMRVFAALARAAQAEILLKLPRGSKKKRRRRCVELGKIPLRRRKVPEHEPRGRHGLHPGADPRADACRAGRGSHATGD